MDPYRIVFYNQVNQLPTLDVDTILLCNERMYTHDRARSKAISLSIEFEPVIEPISLSNDRVDTIRLAAILAYGTDEQWNAAWLAATTLIELINCINFIRNMSDDCVGALFYWIRELAPKRLYTAQTAERFCTIEDYGDGGNVYHVKERHYCIHLLYQARFHEAAKLMPRVMLGLGFREEVFLAVPEILETDTRYYSLKAIAYSMNDVELHAVAYPDEEWSVKNHLLVMPHEEQSAMFAESLYDQWTMARNGNYSLDDQNFKYYTQTLAELKDCILQTPSFRVDQLRRFERHVDISPESPTEFFNQVCAAKYLGVLLGVEEGYYRCVHMSALERVCAIAARLPTDLQHILALRMAGSMSEVLPQRLADRAYFELDVEPDEYVRQHIRWEEDDPLFIHRN